MVVEVTRGSFGALLAEVRALPLAARLAERDETVTGVTVDAADARDLDDAIMVQRRPGGWRVDVSIADVAAVVPRGGPLDEAAHRRVFSRYDSVPRRLLLPAWLAEDRLSLLPGQRRLATTITVELSDDLARFVAGVRPTAVVSHRLDYEEADAAILTGAGPHATLLRDAAELGVRLQAARLGREFASVMERVSGQAWGDVQREGSVSRFAVGELMLLANAAAAHLAHRAGIPFLYRAQRPGAGWGARAARQLRPAHYTPEPAKHAGLGLPLYTHVTSPLRRLPDLVNLRQLTAAVAGRPLPYSRAELASVAERANAAERAGLRSRQRLGPVAVAPARTLAQVRQLDGEGFYRLVRAGGTSTLHARVQAELYRRLQAGHLGARELAALLIAAVGTGVGDGWSGRLLGAAAARLRDHPPDAVAAWTIAAQQAPATWSLPRFDTDASGPPHAPIFRAVARGRAAGLLRESPPAEGSSRRQAEQRAAAECLIAALDRRF